MNNRDRLIELVADHKLERREVAEFLKVKTETVSHWLASHESHNYEDIPDMAIELLELKLRSNKI